MRRISGLAAVALLIVLAVSAAARAKDGGLRVYSDTEAGFGLAFPKECVLKKTGKGSYFTLESSEGHQLIAGEIYRLADLPNDMFRGSRDVIRDFAVDRALARCCADGADGTAYCKSVYRISQTATGSGVRIIELFLGHVQVQYTDPPESTRSIVGPVYVLDVSRPEETLLLMLGSLPYQRMSDEQIELARGIVASVRLLEVKRPEPHQEAAPKPTSPAERETSK